MTEEGKTQPRSQGPLSTSRKYLLEVERGPWERGWVRPQVFYAHKGILQAST